MTEDKNLIKNLEYLDLILKHFIDKGYKSDFITVSNEIFHLKLNQIGKPVFDKNDSLDIIFEKTLSPDNKDDVLFYKVRSSIIYLVENKFITLIKGDFCMQITYEGIIKYSEGFVMEYEKHSSDKTRLLNVENFQKTMSRKMYYITFWIMVGTLVAALYYNS